MKEKRNEGGKWQREGCTLGLLLTGLNLPLPPIFQPRASKGDFIGVFVCVCVFKTERAGEHMSTTPRLHMDIV